jgi:hypothetical protein
VIFCRAGHDNAPTLGPVRLDNCKIYITQRRIVSKNQRQLWLSALHEMLLVENFFWRVCVRVKFLESHASEHDPSIDDEFRHDLLRQRARNRREIILHLSQDGKVTDAQNPVSAESC